MTQVHRATVTTLDPRWYYQDDLRRARVDVSLATWCATHGLEPFSVVCDRSPHGPGCGAERRTTIPFRLGGCVGLVAPRCACGNPFGPFETRALDGSLSLPAAPKREKPRWKRRRPKVIALRRAT